MPSSATSGPRHGGQEELVELTERCKLMLLQRRLMPLQQLLLLLQVPQLRRLLMRISNKERITVLVALIKLVVVVVMILLAKRP